MRVLYDHNVFLRGARTGVSRYFCDLVMAGRKLNQAELTIAARLHTNAFLDESGLVRPSLRLPSNRYTNRFLTHLGELSLRSTLRMGEWDIIHETHYSGRRYGKGPAKIAYTVHDLIPELMPEYFRGYETIIRHRQLAFASDAHFVAISQNTATDLQRIYRVSPERIRVIHHGRSKLPDPGDVRRRSDLVLYVGTRGSYKNFSNFVAALGGSRLLREEVELLMFGGKALTSSEIAMLEAAGIRRYSHDHGDDLVLARAYREATVFVYPSRYEGFGLPLLEAMALDCPIICSRASCFPEIAGDAAHFFDPSSVEDMTERIAEVVTSASLQVGLAARGADRVKTFTWQRSATEHLAFYRSMIDR